MNVNKGDRRQKGRRRHRPRGFNARECAAVIRPELAKSLPRPEPRNLWDLLEIDR